MPIVVATPLPLGTGLDLCAVWFNAAADLADVMAFEYAGDSLSLTASKRAEARQLVDRVRLVRRGTRKGRSFSVTLHNVTAAQRLWLEDHVAELLCVRDHVGSKFYAAFMDSPFDISTFPQDDTYYSVVKLTMTEITHSESV